MSRYTDFVKAHIGSAPGATQADKMRHVAAAWKKHKAGGMKGAGAEAAAPAAPMAAMAGGACQNCEQKGAGRKKKAAPRRAHAVAPASSGPSLLTGGSVIDALAPSNEIEGAGVVDSIGKVVTAPFRGIASLFGGELPDEDELEGGGKVLDGIAKGAQILGSIGGLALPFLL